MEISDRHLVRTCKIDLAHDLLQRSSRRELAESSLVSLLHLLPKTTLNEHHAFTTRVALVLLVCSHWWFWVLSTFSFRILTTHCLGSLGGIFFWSNQFFKATCYFNICKKKHPFPRPPNHQPKPPQKLTLMLCCVVCCVLCLVCYVVLCYVMYPPGNFLYKIEVPGYPYNPLFYPSIKCFFFFLNVGKYEALFGVFGMLQGQPRSPFYRGTFWGNFWGLFLTLAPIL